MQSVKLTTGYIVDDSDSIRQRLVSMLEAIQNVAVVGEASNASDAIGGILAIGPDFVLLDLNLGSGSDSGIDVLSAVHRQLPAVEFIVLTNHSEPQYRQACAKAGARYFLDKSTEFDSVPSVIADIAAQQN
ncbi:MAG: response regulator transcription factor [Betaproteobacteria bacterium]